MFFSSKTYTKMRSLFPAIIHDLHNLGFRHWQEKIKSSTHRRQSRSFTLVSDLQTKQPERQTKKCSFRRHAPLKESLHVSMAAARLGMLGAVLCASIGGNIGQHGHLVISGCEP